MSEVLLEFSAFIIELRLILNKNLSVIKLKEDSLERVFTK